MFKVCKAYTQGINVLSEHHLIGTWQILLPTSHRFLSAGRKRHILHYIHERINVLLNIQLHKINVGSLWLIRVSNMVTDT